MNRRNGLPRVATLLVLSAMIADPTATAAADDAFPVPAGPINNGVVYDYLRLELSGD